MLNCCGAFPDIITIHLCQILDVCICSGSSCLRVIAETLMHMNNTCPQYEHTETRKQICVRIQLNVVAVYYCAHRTIPEGQVMLILTG
jgi:hypothetical protein